MSDSLPEPVLLLIIRFTTSNPDLTLPVTSPRTTTTLVLKQLVRANLPPSLASNRLRLIHAGKVLQDGATLAGSINVTSPPRSKPGGDGGSSRGKGKGKASLRTEGVEEEDALTTPIRVYIHCSIGDPLTPEELAAEAEEARKAEAVLTSPQASSSVLPTSSRDQDAAVSTTSGSRTTAQNATPLGFDRLLQTGFTPAEVASLRSQFQAVLAHTHTPDDMPTGNALRALEERWLDSSSSPNAPNGNESAQGEEGWGTSFGADDGGLDDMLWGNVIGFFWPLGALCWGFRESGVWTRRRQIAVATGVLINIAFGFARLTS